MALRGRLVLAVCGLHLLQPASAIRDNSVDRLTLDVAVPDILEQQQDAQEDASYVDCLRRWEAERQRQLKFTDGFTHLVSAEKHVQRLHLSLHGHGRDLTSLVAQLQRRLGLLSRTGLRYAERLKFHVDELHPRLSERCKNATLDVHDLRDEILSAVSSRRRSGTLAKVKADMRQRTADYEQKRLAKEAPVEATGTTSTATLPVAVATVAENATATTSSSILPVAVATVAENATLASTSLSPSTSGSSETAAGTTSSSTLPVVVAAVAENVTPVAQEAEPQMSTTVAAVNQTTESSASPVVDNATAGAENVSAEKNNNGSAEVANGTELLKKQQDIAREKQAKNLFPKNATIGTEVMNQMKAELEQCSPEDQKGVVLSNDPFNRFLPCALNAPMIRCEKWFLRYSDNLLWSDKIKLQSYWILLLCVVLLGMFLFQLYRQHMQKHTKEAVGKRSQEELQAAENRALSAAFHRFFGGHLQSSMVMLVVDLITASIPISNIIIYSLATEDQVDEADLKSEMKGDIARFCADWHDVWMLASVIVLTLFQVVRAVAASGHHPYSAYGHAAWAMYLATDLSAMGDTVAIVLSAWSLCYCRTVRWNWTIFSFIRTIEALGHWGIGVNFYGFSQEASEDYRMIRALAVFGLVIWILIGSLYYVTNSENAYSKWEYARVGNKDGGDLGKWQRFESIPSAMFFALLTLNKKNPLAHVFVTWYEKMVVMFVNICCVPLFSLVSSMIGGAIMRLVLSQEKPSEETLTEQAGDGNAEDDEEEEEEEEEEVDEEVEDPAEALEEENQVPYWQQWKDWVETLTWEEHLHPALIAFMGFGSLIFYGLSTAQREMKWFFVEIHQFPWWAFPLVDGIVGAFFLADWLHSWSALKSSATETEVDEVVSPEEAQQDPQVVSREPSSCAMSTWRHIAYFLSSVPGLVDLLLTVIEVAGGDTQDIGKYLNFFCLCCLWRIYLLEKWLDHPFSAASEALYSCRKQMVTTGAVSVFFWFLGALLLFFTEFDNPDKKIREFYGSVTRSIWASSLYLNGEWVFCDFSWAGKAVGGFIVLFGVSIVVVPMSVFTGYFLMNLQGDFYVNEVGFLKAEVKDLWQLKMRPGPEEPTRKMIFEMLYEHLIQLSEGLKAKNFHDSISKHSLSTSFKLFKWLSITASLLFALLTVLENSEYMDTNKCGTYAEETWRAFFRGKEQVCVDFIQQVDRVEYGIDVAFLTFFVVEFGLRVFALGWRHFVSELGFAEMMCITGLVVSLTDYREDALHQVHTHAQDLMLGSVTFLRLTRLISIGSYFGLLRALRKVRYIARWSLLKSFYFLATVWVTHAMLLHFAERKNHNSALAGAQILPAAPPNTTWLSQGAYDNMTKLLTEKVQLGDLREGTEDNSSFLENATDFAVEATNISNESTVANDTLTSLTKHCEDVTCLWNLTSHKPVLVVPKYLNQSQRYGDYLSAMQYSLQHLTGDYPIVEYSFLGKLVLLLGLIIGTCAMAAWTAVFSSSMVNYLANEAEDQVAKAAENRMLTAIDVVLRLQRQWRRRKRARDAARARGETWAPTVEAPELREGMFLRLRNKARRLILRHNATGEAVVRFFQLTLLFNIAFGMIFSLPEFDQYEYATKNEEMLCTFIFTVELVLMMVAGKGRQGHRWYFFRFVDAICIVPGLMEIYQIKQHLALGQLGKEDPLHDQIESFKKDTKILLDALSMIRVIRVLFWHQWRQEVQVVVDGIVQAGPILILPAFLSLLIWVMSSAMFVWMENVYSGPSKAFFTSVSTGMYWTSSFLIGEWTLADFSPGGGNRVCIAIVLFGIMGFGIATGILLEAVQQAIAVADLQNTSFEDLAKMAEEEKASSRSKKGATTQAGDGRSQGGNPALDRSAQLRRAAKVAQMTKQMAERKS